MLFQETTPDTSAYMIAGYTIFFILLAIYLFSLFIRTRNLNQDLSILEGYKKQSDDSVKASSLPVKTLANTRQPVKRKTARTKSSKRNQVKKKVIKKK
jgi:hypothetical protein